MSMHSEGTMTPAGSEEETLEDVVLELMKGNGFLSNLKGQIAQFIQHSGNINTLRHLHPERADSQMLLYIYEYLQWIGMKHTCTTLLSESPVKVDTSQIKPMDSLEMPKLQAALVAAQQSELELEAKLLSLRHNSKPEQEVEAEVEDPSTSDVFAVDKDTVLSESPVKMDTTPLGIPQLESGLVPAQETKLEIKLNLKPDQEFEDSSTSEAFAGDKDAQDVISFLSESESESPVKIDASHVKPLNSNSLESPPKVQSILVPVKLPEVEESVKNLKPDQEVEDSSTSEAFAGDKDAQDVISFLSESESESPVKIDASHVKPLNSNSLESPPKAQSILVPVEQPEVEESVKNLKPDQEVEDSSTSEILSLSIAVDEDTQDVSISSDTKDMSSCEHVVSIK